MMTEFCVICGDRIAASGGAWIDAFGDYGQGSHFHRPETRVS